MEGKPSSTVKKKETIRLCIIFLNKRNEEKQSLEALGAVTISAIKNGQLKIKRPLWKYLFPKSIKLE